MNHVNQLVDGDNEAPGDDIFDMQLLQNYVDHNHTAKLAADDTASVRNLAVRGT